MKETRRGVAFEALTPSTCHLLATNSKMLTARRSRPTYAPCGTVMGRCMQRVEVVVAGVGCSLGMAERDEQNAEQVHMEYVEALRLQGGQCVTLKMVPRGRREKLVRCVWMAMARAGLACLPVRDHAHAVEE